MLNGELSEDQELRLHQILNLGINSLSHSSQPPSQPSQPSSHPFNYKKDLEALQEQLATLEEQIQTSPVQRASGRCSPSLLTSIESSQKALRQIERTISTPTRGRPGSLKRELERLKKELVAERKRHTELKKENQGLSRKGGNLSGLYSKLDCLMTDYQALVKSFDRSENIRNRQKEIIEDLKAELFEVAEEEPKPKARTKKRAYR